jgi:hypothetical protein
MTTSSPAAADFRFIEIAAGALSHRNVIVDADTYTAPTGKAEQYRSVYLHLKDLDDYAITHPVKTKTGEVRPSVAGYDGAVLATAVHFDLDHTDLDVPLTWARLLIRRLHYEYDVPLAAIRCAFSGSKGFHLHIPASLFGGFAPGVDVPGRIKRLALALVEGLEIALDTTVYERIRLWREPNTINTKSGLYKIPLRAEEVLTLDIEAIKDLAATPREIETTPDDEWLPRPELVALWEATEQPDDFYTLTVAAAPEPREATAGQARAIAVTILAGALPATGRHPALLALAGGLARAGWKADPIRNLVADVAVKAMGQEGADRHESGEWERIAADSVAKVTDGKHVVGWPTLAESISDVAVAAVRQILGLNEPKAHTHVFIGKQRLCCAGDPATPNEPPESDKARTRRETKERRRRVQYARLLRRERELKHLIRDPALSPGDKVHALVMREVFARWERQPTATGEYRLPMRRQAEACGVSRSTFAKRVDDLADKTGAYAVRRQTLKVPAIDVRTGTPIINEKTGRPEVWRETQVLVTPHATSDTLIDAVLGRTNMPNPAAAKQQPRYKARGLYCRTHPHATIIMETRILRFCAECKQSVAPPLKRDREYASDPPAGGVWPRSTPGQNLTTPPTELQQQGSLRNTAGVLTPPQPVDSLSAREWNARFHAPPGQNLATPSERGETFRMTPGPARVDQRLKPPPELVAELEAIGGDA